MKRIILLLSLVTIIPMVAFGQDDASNQNPFRQELGINAGLTTGVGMSYRYWGNMLGIQVSGIPVKAGNEFFISGALTGLLSLRNTKYVRVYGYWGNHFHYLSRKYTNAYDQTSTNIRKGYNTGLGFGCSLGRVVAFNISLGYAAYNVFGGVENVSFLPTGEMGLYYRF